MIDYNNYFHEALRLLSLMLITTAFMISCIRNRDMLSPVKIYVAFTVIFYLDIFISDYATDVLLIYSLICMIIFCLALIEPKGGSVIKKFKREAHLKELTVAIWLLSSISIINQIVVINELGGLASYIENIAFRVDFFKGKGYIVILNSMMATMNVLYFSLLFSQKRVANFELLLFAVHFVIFVSMALLSGSRSFLLMSILVQLIIYNRIRKRLTLTTISLAAITIIVSASILGGVRNTVTVDDNEVKVSSLEDILYESTHFKYGLIPLEILFESDEKPLLYGSTYASLVTNFFPRSLFPNKLDSGGIAFTKIYTNDQWGGLSNLATGLVTEGVINFGYFFGLLIGFATLALSLLAGLYVYSKMSRNELGIGTIVLYVYLILAFSRLSYSEFSYTYFTFVTYYLIPIAAAFAISKILQFKLKRWFQV